MEGSLRAGDFHEEESFLVLKSNENDVESLDSEELDERFHLMRQQHSVASSTEEQVRGAIECQDQQRVGINGVPISPEEAVDLTMDGPSVPTEPQDVISMSESVPESTDYQFLSESLSQVMQRNQHYRDALQESNLKLNELMSLMTRQTGEYDRMVTHFRSGYEDLQDQLKEKERETKLYELNVHSLEAEMLSLRGLNNTLALDLQKAECKIRWLEENCVSLRAEVEQASHHLLNNNHVITAINNDKKEAISLLEEQKRKMQEEFDQERKQFQNITQLVHEMVEENSALTAKLNQSNVQDPEKQQSSSGSTSKSTDESGISPAKENLMHNLATLYSRISRYFSDKAQESPLVTCPLCMSSYSKRIIEHHAAQCQGPSGFQDPF